MDVGYRKLIYLSILIRQLVENVFQEDWIVFSLINGWKSKKKKKKKKLWSIFQKKKNVPSAMRRASRIGHLRQTRYWLTDL